MSKITVQNIEITIDKDDICLTDMAKNHGGNTVIQNWIRNKNTLEFLGAWESIYNPNFNSVEFHRIMHDAGVERYIISPKQWTDKTQAIGIKSKAGKYGGTYAHKDIATEFATWLSPMFKLLLIKEFQRLKEEEANRLNSGWDVRRLISKANYKIQTDAIAQNLIPARHLPKDKEFIVYAEEADLVNYALFGMTAKEWREAHPKDVTEGFNIRDTADMFQLIVISNLESINGEMIHQGISKNERYRTMVTVANSQLKSLSTSKAANKLQNAQSPNIKQSDNQISEFDRQLKGLINVPPPHKEK